MPQIIANLHSGVRKPLKFGYIWSVTICKLFYPFYLGLCPNNFMLLKPKPFEVAILTVTILFEVKIELIVGWCSSYTKLFWSEVHYPSFFKDCAL